MSTPIQIFLDDQALSLPAPLSLADLLQAQQRAPESVATALNGMFVAREARAQTQLTHGDAVLLFKAIVGG